MAELYFIRRNNQSKLLFKNQELTFINKDQ